MARGFVEYSSLRVEELRQTPPLDERAMPEELRALLASPGRVYEHPSWDMTAVAAEPADERMRSLCRFYGDAAREVQGSMRAAVGWPLRFGLLEFALRSAVFALRERRQDLLRDAVLAVALEDLAGEEPRDDITILQKIRAVGEHAGLAPLELLRDLLPSAGPPIAAILEDYFLCCPPDTVGEGFSFALIETSHGPAFAYP